MFVIKEVQSGDFNGNVWGPYETREEAERYIEKVRADTEKYWKGIDRFNWIIHSIRKEP